MNWIPIVAVGFIGYYLNKDYNTDKGEHINAKVFHAIALIILGLAYANILQNIKWNISNWRQALIIYGEDVGIVPGEVSITFHFIKLVVASLVLILVYQLITRNETARERLLYCLPVLAATEVFSFY